MTKRIVTFLLALVMVLIAIPVVNAAEENNEVAINLLYYVGDAIYTGGGASSGGKVMKNHYYTLGYTIPAGHKVVGLEVDGKKLDKFSNPLSLLVRDKTVNVKVMLEKIVDGHSSSLVVITKEGKIIHQETLVKPVGETAHKYQFPFAGNVILSRRINGKYVPVAEPDKGEITINFASNTAELIELGTKDANLIPVDVKVFDHDGQEIEAGQKNVQFGQPKLMQEGTVNVETVQFKKGERRVAYVTKDGVAVHQSQLKVTISGDDATLSYPVEYDRASSYKVHFLSGTQATETIPSADTLNLTKIALYRSTEKYSLKNELYIEKSGLARISVPKIKGYRHTGQNAYTTTLEDPAEGVAFEPMPLKGVTGVFNTKPGKAVYKISYVVDKSAQGVPVFPEIATPEVPAPNQTDSKYELSNVPQGHVGISHIYMEGEQVVRVTNENPILAGQQDVAQILLLNKDGFKYSKAIQYTTENTNGHAPIATVAESEFIYKLPKNTAVLHIIYTKQGTPGGNGSDTPTPGVAAPVVDPAVPDVNKLESRYSYPVHVYKDYNGQGKPMVLPEAKVYKYSSQAYNEILVKEREGYKLVEVYKQPENTKNMIQLNKTVIGNNLRNQYNDDYMTSEIVWLFYTKDGKTYFDKPGTHIPGGPAATVDPETAAPLQHPVVPDVNNLTKDRYQVLHIYKNYSGAGKHLFDPELDRYSSGDTFTVYTREKETFRVKTLYFQAAGSNVLRKVEAAKVGAGFKIYPSVLGRTGIVWVMYTKGGEAFFDVAQGNDQPGTPNPGGNPYITKPAPAAPGDLVVTLNVARKDGASYNVKKLTSVRNFDLEVPFDVPQGQHISKLMLDGIDVLGSLGFNNKYTVKMDDNHNIYYETAVGNSTLKPTLTVNLQDGNTTIKLMSTNYSVGETALYVPQVPQGYTLEKITLDGALMIYETNKPLSIVMNNNRVLTLHVTKGGPTLKTEATVRILSDINGIRSELYKETKKVGEKINFTIPKLDGASVLFIRDNSGSYYPLGKSINSTFDKDKDIIIKYGNAKGDKTTVTVFSTIGDEEEKEEYYDSKLRGSVDTLLFRIPQGYAIDYVEYYLRESRKTIKDVDSFKYDKSKDVGKYDEERSRRRRDERDERRERKEHLFYLDYAENTDVTIFLIPEEDKKKGNTDESRIIVKEVFGKRERVAYDKVKHYREIDKFEFDDSRDYHVAKIEVKIGDEVRLEEVDVRDLELDFETDKEFTIYYSRSKGVNKNNIKVINIDKDGKEKTVLNRNFYADVMTVYYPRLSRKTHVAEAFRKDATGAKTPVKVVDQEAIVIDASKEDAIYYTVAEGAPVKDKKSSNNTNESSIKIYSVINGSKTLLEEKRGKADKVMYNVPKMNGALPTKVTIKAINETNATTVNVSTGVMELVFDGKDKEVVMEYGATQQSTPGAEYRNIPNQADVDRSMSKPFLKGTGKGMFHPQRSVTRAEAAAMLTRLMVDFNEQSVDKSILSAYYNDYDPNAWYVANFAYLAQKGHLQRVFQGQLSPNTPITRGELAALMFAIKIPQSAEQTWQMNMEAYVPVIQAAIGRAQSMGWLKGYPDGTLKPSNVLTRAEAVTVFCNVIGVPTDMLMGTAKGSYKDVKRNDWFYNAVMNGSKMYK